MTDESIMPFGQHKGKQMINVPASYLIWLYENNKCTVALKKYIEDAMVILKAEVNNESKRS